MDTAGDYTEQSSFFLSHLSYLDISFKVVDSGAYLWPPADLDPNASAKAPNCRNYQARLMCVHLQHTLLLLTFENKTLTESSVIFTLGSTSLHAPIPLQCWTTGTQRHAFQTLNKVSHTVALYSRRECHHVFLSLYSRSTYIAEHQRRRFIQKTRRGSAHYSFSGTRTQLA